MNPETFKTSITGEVILTPLGNHAFIPNPLPRALPFESPAQVKQIADAERALGKLGGIAYLSEVTGKQRNRVYAARELLRLLQEDDAIYVPKGE